MEAGRATASQIDSDIFVGGCRLPPVPFGYLVTATNIEESSHENHR